MGVHTQRLTLNTKGDCDVVDLTARLRDAVKASGVREGVATVFVPGSTAAVTTIEHEPGLVADLRSAFDRLVPRDLSYGHNRGGESNGHSHVRAALVGPSVSVPVLGGNPALGTWQQLVVIDFDDRARSREVIVQVVGED
ncbi:MAG: YjbQ family protein [Acidobacteria bacterium]|nr:YjbQ family protein [Acidobacteriota bacterium]